MCDVHKLKLGLKKCDDTNYVVTVQEQQGSKGIVDINLCRGCWEKVSKNDNFYTKVEKL